MLASLPLPGKWNISITANLREGRRRALPPPPRVNPTKTTVNKNAKESFSPCALFFSLSLSLSSSARARVCFGERACVLFLFLWIFGLLGSTFSKNKKNERVERCLLCAFIPFWMPLLLFGLPFEGWLPFQKQPKQKNEKKTPEHAPWFFCLVNIHYY